jgi:hypothetical protein
MIQHLSACSKRTASTHQSCTGPQKCVKKNLAWSAPVFSQFFKCSVEMMDNVYYSTKEGVNIRVEIVPITRNPATA